MQLVDSEKYYWSYPRNTKCFYRRTLLMLLQLLFPEPSYFIIKLLKNKKTVLNNLLFELLLLACIFIKIASYKNLIHRYLLYDIKVLYKGGKMAFANYYL